MLLSNPADTIMACLVCVTLKKITRTTTNATITKRSLRCICRRKNTFSFIIRAVDQIRQKWVVLVTYYLNGHFQPVTTWVRLRKDCNLRLRFVEFIVELWALKAPTKGVCNNGLNIDCRPGFCELRKPIVGFTD